MAAANEAQIKVLDEDALLACCVCRGQLEDPQQLECLHGCCRRCLGQIISQKDGRLITCPECCYVSETSRVTVSSFVQTLVRRREAFTKSMACALCEDKCDVTSMCEQCREFLSNDCSQFTSSSGSQTFDMKELNDVKGLHDIFRTAGSSLQSLVTRNAHEKKTGRRVSREPIHSNADGRQSRPCDGNVAGRKCGEKVMASVAGLEAAYLRNFGAFAKRRELTREIQEARVQQRKLLQERKLRLLDAIDSVYSVAERTLDDIFDDLEAKADDLTTETERLERAASYAVSFCRIAVSAEGGDLDATLATQPLLKCVERLTKEVSSVRLPSDIGTLVSVKHLMPECLKDTVATWIGIPTMITDNLEPDCGDDDSALHGAAAQRPSKHFIFSRISGSFELAVDCYDIAIAHDGRLLLAAREHGLLECSATGGELVTSYFPPPRPHSGKVDWITAVDSTCDRRVVAGVYWQRMVVVLALGSAGWGEVQRITDVLLTAHLSHMSLHAKVVAATGPVSDGRGSALSIVSLDSGRVLHRQAREYAVRSVAITSTSLITASGSRVELSDSSGRSANLVDAYNYRGDVHLWSYIIGEDELATDVSFNFIDQTLYIAIESCDGSDQRRIVAVRAEDGAEIETSIGGGVVVNGAALEGLQLHRIAWAKIGQETLLAALSYYTASVALFAPARDGSNVSRGARRVLGDALQSLKLQPGKALKTFLKHQKPGRKKDGSQAYKLDRSADM